MTIPATSARMAAATITGTRGRRGRRGPPEAGACSRSPSIAAAGSSYGRRSGPSTRVASGSAGGGSTLPGGIGHGCGPVDGDGGVGRRGAYQESQGVASGCDRGAAAGDTGADNAAWGKARCGKAGTTGNGAVDGSDGAALPVAGCPQTGQNKNPGCTGCPHAGLPEPATPAIVTAG